jgi:hypothetical protein
MAASLFGKAYGLYGVKSVMNSNKVIRVSLELTKNHNKSYWLTLPRLLSGVVNKSMSHLGPRPILTL